MSIDFETLTGTVMNEQPAGAPAQPAAGDAAALHSPVAADDALPQQEVPPRIAHCRQWPLPNPNPPGRPLLGHVTPSMILISLVLPSAIPDRDRLFKVQNLVLKKLRCQILDCYSQEEKPMIVTMESKASILLSC